ncbi:helix-turn-helix domain-containing protein [Mycolicibacterium brisbanense]|uniref:Uncharacterized protein n=1 Tax=Mycolicibacterium brisbanense TaxID=146020 RepID=A0A100W6W8_9MYCO|nr:helix-turn-helix domain-containing protein [Mycolicibacterium brisbanense]MCV7157993.1 helix-turn-helix domain-containing protein [Mycolicibacterium brisbanense]GAS92641.1 uncharacterized protein RMCB_6737 [Mycolicibacterium brisbanense]
MSTDVALADDGLTVEFEDCDDRPDLTADEAEAVTGRIRQWVNDFPIADVVLAFRGRVWVALAYSSWAEWCECELGGLKLPAPKRRAVVAKLADAGMSGRAIADTLGVNQSTVARDQATDANASVDPNRKTLGQDGRERRQPQPKPDAPQLDSVIDAEIVCRDCDGFGCETCVPADDSAATDEQIAEMAELSDEQFESATAPNSESRPAAQSPRRRPLPDAFGSASYELRKSVERVVRLTGDDRMKKNKDQIVGANLSDLIRARDALAGVIQQLEG